MANEKVEKVEKIEKVEVKKSTLNREQLIIALCAGKFEGSPFVKAKDILKTADEILKQINEGY